VKSCVDFALASPVANPPNLALQLEYAPNDNHNNNNNNNNNDKNIDDDKNQQSFSLTETVVANAATAESAVDPNNPAAMAACRSTMSGLRLKAKKGSITIAEAVNLAILEEMVRDPTTVRRLELK